jgi:hypothetical protein
LAFVSAARFVSASAFTKKNFAKGNSRNYKTVILIRTSKKMCGGK